MNWLDFILLVIIASSIWSGFRIGFIRVGIGFLAAGLGLLFGFWLYGIPAAWLKPWIHSAAVANLLGFCIVIFGFMLAGGIVGFVISRMFRLVGLGFVDRLAGAVFGLVRGSLVVVAIVCVLLAFVPKPPPDFLTESAVTPYAVEASRMIAALAPRALSDAVNEGISSIKKIWQDRLKRIPKKLPAQEV